MKRILVLWFLAIGCAWAGSESKSASGGPKLTFEKTRQSSGEVSGDRLVQEFAFKNTGDKILEIRGIQPGCGCTVTVMNIDGKKVEKPGDGIYRIEPGHAGSIRAEVKITGMKGRIEKYINVTSNDSEAPTTQLIIQALVKEDLMISPQASVAFGPIQVNTVTDVVLNVRSTMPEPLVVEKVETEAPWLTAKVISTTTNIVQIEVATKPPLPSGKSQSQVVLTLKNEKHKELRIPANIDVPPIITFMPSRLFFFKPQAKPSTDVVVQVKRNDGKEFHITGIDPGSPLLTTSFTTNKPGQEYFVSVKYTPKGGEPPAKTTLVIETDEATSPKVELPVYFPH